MIGVLIAAASILGAVVVWRASVESSNASDLTQQGVQQLILQQQTQGSIEARVARDFQLFGQFQEHVLNWHLLLAQADRKASSEPSLASRLRSQARSELTQARHIRPFIRSFDRPTYGNRNGIIQFEPATQVQALVDANLELAGLHPGSTFVSAAAAHARALHLVGIAVLFAAALLFLTFAQVARRGARGIFAGAGVVVMSVATILFAIVGVWG
jgi:hypothetical protein